MPKGFNQKAIDGFMQWMKAVMSETGLENAKVEASIRETKRLMSEGFPQIRKH